MERSMRSTPPVGPMMKPWSQASMRERPSLGLKMRARRFFMPQSRLEQPLRGKPMVFWGVSMPKEEASLKLSMSGIGVVLLLADWLIS